MLLWQVEGSGEVWVNGEKLACRPGMAWWLPWKMSIRYHAAAKHPFLMGGIHIIPRHDMRHAVSFAVAHSSHHPLAHVSWRGHASLGLPGFLPFLWNKTPSLPALASYAVHWFTHADKKAAESRHLAQLVIRELSRVEACSPEEPPAEFVQFLEDLARRLSAPVSLDAACAQLKISPATLRRWFQKWTGLPPQEWILTERLHQACLLLRSSGLEIHEVGRRVGIPDPYYFSRIFRQRIGATPTKYRRSRSLVMSKG